MKTFEIEAAFVVQCEGVFRRGKPARFDNSFGNWLPGEPDEVSKFKVYINSHGIKTDITSAISTEEREIFMSYFIEHCRNDDDGDYSFDSFKDQLADIVGVRRA